MTAPFFTEKQKDVLRLACHRWNILSGATRSGKTFVSYFLALRRVQQHRAHNILFAGKTLSTLDRNVFDPMRQLFGGEHIGAMRSDATGGRKITIFGKDCYCVGANDDRAIAKIQGLGLGYAYCDEITTFPENFFQMLASRLDRADSICDATCNPESPSHFIKKHIDNHTVDVFNVHFTIYDNTFLSAEFVHNLENQYRGTIYFDRWILGNWVKTEGLVFPLFRREKHLLTPLEYLMRYGRHRLQYVIWGGDGATTNDATTIQPLAVMDNGQAVRLEPFYHDPHRSGPLSNAQLVPYIGRYLDDMERSYRFAERGVQHIGAVDCAASDLVLTLAANFPAYNFHKYTRKDIMQTTDTVNNALSRNAVIVLNFRGYHDYVRGEFVPGDDQLVVDLEAMTWSADGKTYDGSIPNDCADAFRYAVCTYYINPLNLWRTPDFSETYKEVNGI